MITLDTVFPNMYTCSRRKAENNSSLINLSTRFRKNTKSPAEEIKKEKVYIRELYPSKKRKCIKKHMKEY